MICVSEFYRLFSDLSIIEIFMTNWPAYTKNLETATNTDPT